LKLKAAAPLTKAAMQFDVDGLALFDACRSPNLI